MSHEQEDATRPRRKKKPKVGAEKSGSLWPWIFGLAAVGGVAAYFLYFRKEGEGGTAFTPLRVPAGTISADQYDCLLGEGGVIRCVPKVNWPANWMAGEQ